MSDSEEGAAHADADRMEALERHVAEQDRAIETLDEMVRSQWRLIEGLRRELRQMRDRMDAAQSDPAVERPPPHY